jgi:hypothetical protein
MYIRGAARWEPIQHETTYIKQQRSDDECHALTVTDLLVVQAVGLHDVQEVVLADAGTVMKVFVRRERPIEVADDRLLVRRRLAHEVRVDGFQLWIL